MDLVFLFSAGWAIFEAKTGRKEWWDCFLKGE